MDLCVLGLSVSFDHTPAAATAHAHVRRFGVSRHARFPCAHPLAEAQPGAGAAQVCLHFPKAQREQARVRKSPWQLRGLCAISCNQRWDPATRWASWRFVPCDGRLGGVGAPNLQPSSLLQPSLPTSLPARAARLRVFGRGLPSTGSRDWSSGLKPLAPYVASGKSFLSLHPCVLIREMLPSQGCFGAMMWHMLGDQLMLLMKLKV